MGVCTADVLTESAWKKTGDLEHELREEVRLTVDCARGARRLGLDQAAASSGND
jgi:hypothetical protein